IAVSTPILTEYRSIRNKYGKIWLSIMVRKKRVHRIDEVEDAALRYYLDECTRGHCPISQCQNFFQKIEEDIHLLETALKSNNLIISNERNCRDKIREVVTDCALNEQFQKLCGLVWIRPIENCDIIDVFVLINDGHITELHQNFKLIID
ncbi:MAG: hypothetical protein WCB46_10485, partial [Methanoregula sp.]